MSILQPEPTAHRPSEAVGNADTASSLELHSLTEAAFCAFEVGIRCKALLERRVTCMNSRQMSSTRRGARSIGEPNLFVAIGVQGLLAVKSSLDRAASQLFFVFLQRSRPRRPVRKMQNGLIFNSIKPCLRCRCRSQPLCRSGAQCWLLWLSVVADARNGPTCCPVLASCCCPGLMKGGTNLILLHLQRFGHET